MTLHQALVEVARLINEHYDVYKFYGICSLTNEVLHTNGVNTNRYRTTFYDLIQSWPEYSGNSSFPVQVGNKCPFKTFFNTSDMWDMETEYGRKRRDLLLYLIKESQDVSV